MSSTTPNISDDEATLIDALRRRDQSAFMRLVTEYGPRMRAVIHRYLRSDADADDALQDAFISAARAIDRFNRESSLSTWLHTIAVRAALMKLRSKKRLVDETGIDPLLPQFNIVGHRVPTTSTLDGAAQELQTRQTQELVRDQIDKLPEMYRAVLLARDIEELSTQEASDALGLSEAALKTRLHRARGALRTLLEPYIRSNAI
jgi:RNA polymerase sigma-70 factor (ECF subfamily)